MPTYSQTTIHYKPNYVLRWSAGLAVENDEDPVATTMKQRKLSFRNGGSQRYDSGWIVVKEVEGEKTEHVKFSQLVTDINSCKDGQTPATAFGYHTAGVYDVLLLLETNEASRLCPEMARGPTSHHPHRAFVDKRGNIPTKESTFIKLKECMESGVEMNAHMGNPVECRVEGGGFHRNEIKIHENLDVILNRGRLPAMQPYTSSRITKCSPIRRAKESGVMVNTVVAYEHMSMIVEASIELSKIDGLKGHQEKLQDGSSIQGFSAHSNSGVQQGDLNDESITRILPRPLASVRHFVQGRPLVLQPILVVLRPVGDSLVCHSIRRPRPLASVRHFVGACQLVAAREKAARSAYRYATREIVREREEYRTHTQYSIVCILLRVCLSTVETGSPRLLRASGAVRPRAK